MSANHGALSDDRAFGRTLNQAPLTDPHIILNEQLPYRVALLIDGRTSIFVVVRSIAKRRELSDAHVVANHKCSARGELDVMGQITVHSDSEFRSGIWPTLDKTSVADPRVLTDREETSGNHDDDVFAKTDGSRDL